MATITISGTDSNLGTITSDIEYSVTTDSGNSISLTRIVNNIQVATRTVKTGFSYSIPITDLPTGTNTIEIIATTDTTSGEISATRTWTYYKTPISIPSTGGVAQLTQNGQNIWPVTVPDAVEAPVYLGGNLNAALNKLGQAALYTKIGSPKYNEVTVDLSKVSVGDEVQLPYNGVMVSHIVVHIGNPDASIYDASCDGVWLLRKDCVTKSQWENLDANTFSDSNIENYMQNVVVDKYGSEVQSSIKTVKIPYCIGGGSTTIQTLANGFECKIFPLSGYEVGYTPETSASALPKDGAKLDYFESGYSGLAQQKRLSKLYGYPDNIEWWLRSCSTENTTSSFSITSFGSYNVSSITNLFGIRPTFIMPTTFSATYYVDSSNNVYPSQEYTTGGSITDVFGYDVPICQYETGSYVGTGTYGEDNPNTLTFGFEPNVLFIVKSSQIFRRALIPFKGYGLCWSDNSLINVGISTYGLAANWSGNSVSWYNNGDVELQMNKEEEVYNYIAIG